MKLEGKERNGVMARKGAGKLRHVIVTQQREQTKAERCDLLYKKDKGVEHAADLMTKALIGIDVKMHAAQVGLEGNQSRAERSLSIPRRLRRRLSRKMLVRFGMISC